MRTIYKYPIPMDDTVAIHPPDGAIFRHFAMQNDQLTIWMEVDTEQPCSMGRVFRIVGTGHTIAPHAEYRGTCFAGPFVWHLYEL